MTPPAARLLSAARVPPGVVVALHAPGPTGPGAVIRRDVLEARREASLILERAEARATERLRAAEEEVAARLASASREAHALQEAAARAVEAERVATRIEGERQGRDTAAAELVGVVAAASRRLAALEREAAPRLQRVAVGLARKVLQQELTMRPEAVATLAAQLLAAEAGQRRVLVLRLHPDDLALVHQRRPALVAAVAASAELTLREDPAVARHGVVLETEAGTIDAQLETQLAALERVLAADRDDGAIATVQP